MHKFWQLKRCLGFYTAYFDDDGEIGRPLSLASHEEVAADDDQQLSDFVVADLRRLSPDG